MQPKLEVISKKTYMKFISTNAYKYLNFYSLWISFF